MSGKRDSGGCEPRDLGGRFQRLGEVNRGGIGRIEAALDPVIHRRVAIKMLLEQHLEDPLVAGRFAQEAQVTGQLDHPNIVPVYDLGEHEGKAFIVMKLIRGKPLADILLDGEEKRDDTGELRRLVQIVIKLCDALSFAHSRGVIHCDLKPDNVIVGHHGEVYLMDWGVAQVQAGADLDETPPASHSQAFSSRRVQEPESDSHVRVSPEIGADTANFRGTPAYMAPEQLKGQFNRIDERTDVFGLGGILYEILTGLVPNDRARLLGPALMDEPVPTPIVSKRWRQLPPGLCRIVLKALEPKREDRYANVSELQQELEQFLLGGGWFESRSFMAGDTIVSEGEAGDSAYIIESGECEVFKEIQGQSVLARRLGPGDVFGETAVLTSATRTASVTAATDVSLRVITGASLNRELDRNPWLAAFVRSLAGLFREADAALSQRGPPPADS